MRRLEAPGLSLPWGHLNPLLCHFKEKLRKEKGSGIMLLKQEICRERVGVNFSSALRVKVMNTVQIPV